ncbi:16S rRNA (uracil(1498)-N(3))-methyltransferase [Thiomicrorhabdus aquaedulcis]|uniref:16S rRNA (uracil(1498)-N(3))-methyltransferase n=1 Tax=Thiomicrorhabdus aquaedulcis TaxID=2211106 RepID=UPI000FDCA29D|nr:16S rRNA (uracil(1498)-N(3))-methyltransferase [Thiomicrorhabdus aquaedulcis]
MRIPRLYLPGDYRQAKPQDTLELNKEQAHYALTVLRLKSGHPVQAFDGLGHAANGVLNHTSRRSAEFVIEHITPCDNESPLNITLVQSISRGERMDISIQKSVELGVSAIQPIFTERCEVRLDDDKLEKRRAQWQAMVINACEQSGRCVVPTVLPIQTYQAWLNEFNQAQTMLLGSNALPCMGLVLDPYAQNRLHTLTPPTVLNDASQPIYVLIGPEGGLTDDEVHLAVQNGFNAIQLGPRILRTETAGPAILAILQALWGDF